MNVFSVTYASGVEEVTVQDDCETLEQFVNTKFGSFDFTKSGTKVKKMTVRQYNNYLRGLSDDVDNPVETLNQLADKLDSEAALGTDAEKVILEKHASDARSDAQALANS